MSTELGHDGLRDMVKLRGFGGMLWAVRDLAKKIRGESRHSDPRRYDRWDRVVRFLDDAQRAAIEAESADERAAERAAAERVVSGESEPF